MSNITLGKQVNSLALSTSVKSNFLIELSRALNVLWCKVLRTRPSILFKQLPPSALLFIIHRTQGRDPRTLSAWDSAMWQPQYALPYLHHLISYFQLPYKSTIPKSEIQVRWLSCPRMMVVCRFQPRDSFLLNPTQEENSVLLPFTLFSFALFGSLILELCGQPRSMINFKNPPRSYINKHGIENGPP